MLFWGIVRSSAYNGYVHGTRKSGRQKKRWIHSIREDCSVLHLIVQEATRRTLAGECAMESNHRRTADACNGIAWAIIELLQTYMYTTMHTCIHTCMNTA